MVRADILFKGGKTKTVYVKDFDELFKRMKSYEDIVRFNAHTIPLSAMRQGRY